MIRVLTTTARLKCVHGGEVIWSPRTEPPTAFGDLAGHQLVSERDLVERATIKGCIPPPGVTPCGRIVSVSGGLYSGWTIDGSPVATELATGMTLSPGGWYVLHADPNAPVVYGKTHPGTNRGDNAKRSKSSEGNQSVATDKVRQFQLTIIDGTRRPVAGLNHQLICGIETSFGTTGSNGQCSHAINTDSNTRVRVTGQTFEIPIRLELPPRLAQEFVSPMNGFGERLWQVTPVKIALDGEGVIAVVDPPPGDTSGLSILGHEVTRWTERDLDYHRTFPQSLVCSALRQLCFSLWDVTKSKRRSTDKALRLVLQQVPVEFVYMDCGRWGGDNGRNRHFGLVWRNVAMLCAFRRTESGERPVSTPRGRTWSRLFAWGSRPHSGEMPAKGKVREQTGIFPVDSVLAGLEGNGYTVEVIGQVQAHGLFGSQNATVEKVQLILPDFHLPIATRPPSNPHSRIPNDGRVFMSPWPPQFPVGVSALTSEVLNEGQWFKLYTDSTIFGAGEPKDSTPLQGTAAGDLFEFLNRVGAIAARGDPVHLIQLGDLYELWTGLDWLCEATPGFREVVELKRSQHGGIAASEVVKGWLEQIRHEYPNIVNQIESLGKAIPCTLLSGNHDQYLIREDCRPEWMSPRQTEYRCNGLYVEHGHNHGADPFNRDGSPIGHDGATKYFFDHNVVHLAPNQRRLHLASAVQQFCERPDFGVYVMGHTHSPFITKIQITTAIRYPAPSRLLSLDDVKKASGLELSGGAWWHANEAKYPNSKMVDDLAPPFRERVSSLFAALRKGGATLEVESTRRSEERAYLMHYAWRIATGKIDPRRIRPHPKVNIIWDHGDVEKSRKAAKEMVRLFKMVHRAALTSNHIRGWAVDVKIVWKGMLLIVDKNGKTKTIESQPRNHRNVELHKVASSYGVYKLLSDDPHWSIDGK